MGWFTPVDSVRLWITIKKDGKIKWSVKLISPVHYETQVKNERATWLELTWDFEGMVTLLSEQHMCKKEIEVWWGGVFMDKQGQSHVYNAETPCSLPRGTNSVSKNNQLLIH